MRYSLVTFSLVLILFLGGCASSSPRLREPAEPKRTDAPLPGSDRVLPSVWNERNAPRDAPTAFPVRGSGPTYGEADDSDAPDPRGNRAPEEAEPWGGAGDSEWRTPPAGTAYGQRSAEPTEVNESAERADNPRTGRGSEVSEGADRETSSREVIRSRGQSRAPSTELIEPGETYLSVQLLVVSSLESATEWQGKAIDRLGESVRVDHEDGLYKLRVGATLRSEAADDLRRRAVVHGFEDAFIVKLEK